MSKLQVKRQAAIRHGHAHAFPFKGYEYHGGKRYWFVYVVAEWDLRGPFTRREAINLAYELRYAKNVEVEITFGEKK